MLNGKVVSVELLIEQLYQDYGFENINKSEVVEWVWRSMAIIGTPYPYEDKNVEVLISDYRSILPVDLYSINMIREKETGIPLREMTDLFFKFPEADASTTPTVNTGDYDTDLVTEFQTIIASNSSSEYYTYKVQGNYMYTGAETCTLELAYKAMPIDLVTGMPTIPDNAVYLRGIESFVAEKLALRMMLRDQLSERKYEIIRQDYFFNVGAAQNICRMPDPTRMETIINRWKSTYLGPEHFDTGFKYLGSRE